MIHNKIGFILNLTTLANCVFTCVITIIVIIRISCYLYSNRSKQEVRITTILSIYIYLLILIYVILLSSMNINTLLGDLYKYNFYSSWCIFRGYLITVIFDTLYCICVNQVIIIFINKYK